MSESRVVTVGHLEYKIAPDYQGITRVLWVRDPNSEGKDWMISAHNTSTLETILNEMTDTGFRPIIELALNPTGDPLEDLLAAQEDLQQERIGWIRTVGL